MIKNSDETKNDQYEPEEGEIQDDDDVTEDALNAVKDLSNNKDSGRGSNSRFLFLRDETKYRGKTDCSLYRGKSYFTPEDEYIRNKFTSRQSSSRERFGTSEECKWYHQRRQSATSKDRCSRKSGGTIESDRYSRETKRTSRDKYYASFFPLPLESKSILNEPLPSNTHFNPSIPTWHWYSRKFKNKNKESNICTSDKLTDGAEQITASNINESHNSLSKTSENISKECHKEDVEKQTDLCPGSPSASDIIEVIQVPRKIPEIITIYDTDEENLKKTSNKTTTNISNNELSAQAQNSNLEKDSNSQNFDGNLNCKSDIMPKSNKNNDKDVQYNLKALISAVGDTFDELKQQELQFQQNSDNQEFNLKINSIDLSLSKNEGNISYNKLDSCLKIPVTDNTIQVNCSSENNVCKDDTLIAKSDVDMNTEKYTMSIQNNTSINVIVSKPLSNKSDVSDCTVHGAPIASCSSKEASHSSCSLSALQNNLENVNRKESSSIFVSSLALPLQFDVGSTNLTEEVESSKENEKSLPYSSNKSTNDFPVQNYVSFNKKDSNMSNKYHSSISNKISFPENIQCSHIGNSEIVLEATNLVPLNENIYYSELDFRNPGTKMTMNNECNDILKNYNDELYNTSTTQESCSFSERVISLTESQECNVTNLNVSNKVWNDIRSDEHCLEVSNIHVNMENIIQIECKDMLDTDKMDVLPQNSIPKIHNGICKEATKKQICDLQHDSTSLLQSNFSGSKQENSAMQASPSEKKEESDSLLGVTIRNEEENSSQIIHCEKNFFWSSCSYPESEDVIKASTVASLKRKAAELKNLKNHDSEFNTSTNIKKSKNELTPPKENNEQRKDTTVQKPSESYTPVYSSSLHGKIKTMELKKFATSNVVPMRSLQNTLNSVGEKYFAYPALVYEDRVGSNNNEARNLKEKITKRIVTVPEFIINLGEESDSDDNSGNESTTKSSKDNEIKEQISNSPIAQRVGIEFEEKLDVLLKQARSQQELKLGYNKSKIISKEQLKLPNPPFNNKKKYLGKGSSTFLQKRVQSSMVNQGCARIAPKSSITKMSYPKVGKEKFACHKMKSSVIKNSSDDLHCDRTIHNDFKHSPSEVVNSRMQPDKSLNKNLTNRGKYFHATSSLVDIRLLSPLKQKEYLKLQKQIAQMTRKKRKNQTENINQSINCTDEDNKTDNAKFNRIAPVRNSNQKESNKLITCDMRNSIVHKTSPSNTKKTAEKSSDSTKLPIPPENVENLSIIQANKEYSHQKVCSKESLSEREPCCDTNKTEVNVVCNAKDVSLHSVFPCIHCNSLENNTIASSTKPLATNILQESSIQQHNQLTVIEKQIQNITVNGCSQETVIYKKGYMLPEKRKSSSSELVQKIKSRENEKPRMKLKATATKETMCTLLQNEVVEDLWSSETKLIAKRREVLEDIAAVHLNLDKIDVVNIRRDQLVRKICNLKEELEQTERQLNQEKQHLKVLNNRVDDSKLCIQRGQSELLSLSLECEELGCKVHGPNYSVPNTCVELIRSEMLVMTKAMQELESQKNSM